MRKFLLFSFLVILLISTVQAQDEENKELEDKDFQLDQGIFFLIILEV